MRVAPTVRILAVGVLLVLAGCSVGYRGSEGGVGPGPGTETTDAASTPTGAPTDRLGWEAGYAANDSLSVTTEDGLNESELNATVARAMARVERIRGLEFTETVPVEVVSREEYRNRSVDFGGTGSDTRAEQYWEALFLVGEDTDAGDVLGSLFGAGVVGYYSPSEDRIVIVSDSETPTVSRGTLSHELVHALQDQHLRLASEIPADTRDGRLAVQGLTEGDPVVVEREYERRCADEWECIPRPRGSSPGGAIARHPGVYLAIVQPYASGPGFVEALRERSGAGWAAVNDAYDNPPESTEQTIHPEAYPDDRPANVSIADRSTEEWEALAPERVGEAGVHVMFWTKGLVPRRDDAVRTNYTHPRSAGWAGDSLVAYTNGSHAGYVWTTVWETPGDARAFERGYRHVLLGRVGARQVADGAYVVDSGPYADAFRIRREGTTVTVVNAPDVEALSEVHPA